MAHFFFEKKGNLILSWILSGFIIFIVNYGLFPYADEDASPVINPVFELIFGLFQRTLWSGNLAWIIFLCINGYGGIIEWSKINRSFFLIRNSSMLFQIERKNEAIKERFKKISF